MTEEEVIKKLEDESKLTFSKDFGFIIGTMSPFIGGGREMQSSSRTHGYEVWKKTSTGSYKLHLHSPLEMNLEFIVAFLTMEAEKFNELLGFRGFFVIKTE